MFKMFSRNLVVILDEKKARKKTLSEEERIVLFVILSIWLGSFGMMIYSSIYEIDSSIWQTIFTSILTAMLGFAVGTNRRIIND